MKKLLITASLCMLPFTAQANSIDWSLNQTNYWVGLVHEMDELLEASGSSAAVRSQMYDYLVEEMYDGIYNKGAQSVIDIVNNVEETTDTPNTPSYTDPTLMLTTTTAKTTNNSNVLTLSSWISSHSNITINDTVSTSLSGLEENFNISDITALSNYQITHKGSYTYTHTNGTVETEEYYHGYHTSADTVNLSTYPIGLIYFTYSPGDTSVTIEPHYPWPTSKESVESNAYNWAHGASTNAPCGQCSEITVTYYGETIELSATVNNNKNTYEFGSKFNPDFNNTVLTKLKTKIAEIAEDFYNDGYFDGYADGYSDGYEAGYADGFADGVQSVKDAVD